MIPYAIKRRVINETSIIEVVSEYVQLKKKGNSMFGLCPFHNDANPSMSVSDKVKMFNCFSCGAKGNVINFVARYESISEELATIKLAKRLGIEVNEQQTAKEIETERLYKVMNDASLFYEFYLNNSEEGVEALNYLHNRGINDDKIKEFHIGLASSTKDYLHLALNKKNNQILDQLNLGLVKENEQGEYYDVFRKRIMFPISDRFGKIVGFSGRVYGESNQAKYINSIENDIFHKSEILYNYYNAIQAVRKMDCIYLFEGFMDVIAAKKAGIDNCVATMGTALTNEHVKMLLSLTKKIILCFDGDSAGIKAMKRSALMLSKVNNIPTSVVLPNGLDPDEFLGKYGAEKLVNYLETNQKNVYYNLYDLAYEVMIPSDLVSVETFKNEVFGFLLSTNQETIHSFFIKKLADDIEIPLEKLNEDFLLFKNKNNYSTNSHDTEFDGVNGYSPNLPSDEYYDIPNSVENTHKPIVKKEVKITPKIRIAYDSIIKHAIYSKERFSIFFEKSFIGGTLRYPGKELMNEYQILLLLQNYYVTNEILGIENIVELLTSQPDLLNTAQNIINDRFIDISQKNNFEECLQTIISFYKKEDQVVAYNRLVSEKNASDFDDYIKIRSNNVQIIRKEKNI